MELIGWSSTLTCWEAAVGGDLATVQRLAPHVDLNSIRFGCTPLAAACYGNHVEVVSYLIAHPRVRMESADLMSDTPLQCASRAGRTRVVELLLRSGRVQVNQRSFEELTPLWMAAHAGHPAVVRLLLAAGADPMIRSGRNLAWSLAYKLAEDVTDCSEVRLLLRQARQDPKETRQRLRRELGWPTNPAALLALAIFLSDNLLQLAPLALAEPQNPGK